MRCILCNFTPIDSQDLKDHYIDFHKVDRDNQFFINLFKRQNKVFRPKKFLSNHQFIVNRDFLVHYGAGRDVFEGKPLNHTLPGEIQKYEITFVQHSQDHDFYNCGKLVDDFFAQCEE